MTGALCACWAERLGLLGWRADARFVTRTTPLKARRANHQLSPSAALRILRSIAYPQSVPSPSLALADAEVEAPDVCDDGWYPGAVATAAAPSTPTPSETRRNWHLNEVPAGWLGTLSPDPCPPTPVTDVTEPPARRRRSKSNQTPPAA